MDDLDRLRERVASQSWNAHSDQWQTIRNARPIPPAAQQQRLSTPEPVQAWIVWERDGLELVDTDATYYAGRDVLVTLSDRRWRTHGVWLIAQDVRRRA
ncbi:hypothetical protein [Cellulomonas sp. HZM]|uniref:hypothetical protein n=1 Tax=Cellulomonas sp. HZM TaxID=1454010 RepID=UPI000492F776|nr:hypothetical protein [Cellulomonas sp. HZM]